MYSRLGVALAEAAIVGSPPAAELARPIFEVWDTTVNVTDAVLPVAVVTVTFLTPAASVEPTANVAVTSVALTTVTLLTLIPGPALTVVPATKLVPVSVTATVVPAVPLEGVMEVSVGVALVAHGHNKTRSQILAIAVLIGSPRHV